MLKLLSRNRSIIIEPFCPEFSTIFLNGALIARAKIKPPINSSSFKFFFAHVSKDSERCAKVAPPPGTIPSSIAALVALIASSKRNFFSRISVSVAAPTFTTATPPANLATRSCNFSFS